MRGVTPTAQPIPTLEEKEEKNCITLSRQRGEKKEEWEERENSLLFCLRRSPDHGTVEVVVGVVVGTIFNFDFFRDRANFIK